MRMWIVFVGAATMLAGCESDQAPNRNQSSLANKASDAEIACVTADWFREMVEITNELPPNTSLSATFRMFAKHREKLIVARAADKRTGEHMATVVSFYHCQNNGDEPSFPNDTFSVSLHFDEGDALKGVFSYDKSVSSWGTAAELLLTGGT